MFESSYDVLTTYEVMDYLNIGKNSLYKLLNSGKLKGFRIGNTWKIPRKAIEKYIDENIEKDTLFYNRKILWDDGIIREMGNMERPFILFHKDKPTHIYFATSDGNPKTGFVHANNTWNMVIPLK